MTSRVGRHYQLTLWDAVKACACPGKFTLLTSSFGVKVSLNPKVGVWFWFGPTQGSFNCPMPTLTTLFALIHYFCDTISWKFLAFISFITWCGTFYVAPCPTKRKVMSYHVLHPFFAGPVWNSSMASWACFILDSFTQDASIGWYPFHLIKYSCFRPLSCLDLSMAFISNSGSLCFGGALSCALD